MLELVVLERAEDDLYEAIRHGVSEYGNYATQAYIEAIRARIRWLCEYPEAGPVRFDLKGRVRSFRQGAHHIYYVRDAKQLTVVRILNVRMDPARHLK